MTQAPNSRCELPTGWGWVRLGDHVLKVGSGITPTGGKDTYVPHGIPLIRSQNVHMNRFGYDGLAFITAKQDAEMQGSRVEPNDVLLNIPGASIGRVCVVPDDICPANVNQHVSIIRLDRSLSPQFLAYFISSSAFQKYITDSQAGATRQALTKALIENFRIPAPPLAEQNRIAAVLRQQMAAVERARAAVEVCLEAAKALAPAYLHQVFNGSEGRAWPRASLGDLVLAPLKTGVSKPGCSESEVCCLTLSAVRTGDLDLCAKKRVKVSEEEAAGNWVEPGGFYVVRGNGNRTLVGRGAFAPAEIAPPLLYPDLLIQVLLNPEKVDPRFMRWVWDYQEVRADIEGRARTAAGIYKINQKNLAAVRIPLPDMATQRRVASTLGGRVAGSGRAQESIRKELEAINALPGALLRRAFNGEL